MSRGSYSFEEHYFAIDITCFKYRSFKSTKSPVSATILTVTFWDVVGMCVLWLVLEQQFISLSAIGDTL